jgi:hypothetical protein
MQPFRPRTARPTAGLQPGLFTLGEARRARFTPTRFFGICRPVERTAGLEPATPSLRGETGGEQLVLFRLRDARDCPQVVGGRSSGAGTARSAEGPTRTLGSSSGGPRRVRASFCPRAFLFVGPVAACGRGGVVRRPPAEAPGVPHAFSYPREPTGPDIPRAPLGAATIGLRPVESPPAPRGGVARRGRARGAAPSRVSALALRCAASSRGRRAWRTSPASPRAGRRCRR